MTNAGCDFLKISKKSDENIFCNNEIYEERFKKIKENTKSILILHINYNNKLFKKDVIQSINLTENSFGIEPEITIKLAKKKFKFFEVGISYRGRSYSEGKKITAKDAIIALFCIFKYGLFG